MSSRDITSKLRQNVWEGSLPLEIRLHRNDCRTYEDSHPYLIQFPRLSYLGLLIHRLHAFFSSNLIFPDVQPCEAWLSYQDVPLKWHYPLGLLYDLYSGAEPAYPPDPTPTAPVTSTIATILPPPLPPPPPDEQSPEATETKPNPIPWRLTLHFSAYPTASLLKLDNEHKTLHDLFIHAVKEADYLRTGTGKTVMFLSKEDSTQLWDGVRMHDFTLYNPINQKLLNPTGVNLRHLPVRLYLPHAATPAASTAPATGEAYASSAQKDVVPGSLRVVQSLVPVNVSSRQPQTIGTALNKIIPSLFPSRRSPLLAQPILHGAVLPLTANVEELVRAASYLDGWLHIAIVMMV